MGGFWTVSWVFLFPSFPNTFSIASLSLFHIEAHNFQCCEANPNQLIIVSCHDYGCKILSCAVNLSRHDLMWHITSNEDELKGGFLYFGTTLNCLTSFGFVVIFLFFDNWFVCRLLFFFHHCYRYFYILKILLKYRKIVLYIYCYPFRHPYFIFIVHS